MIFAEIEWSRWVSLGQNTLSLIVLTLLLSLPIAIPLAVGLFRVRIVGRSAALLILLLGAFVPLPLFALAWQSHFRSFAHPWSTGILPAAFIHALASLPWMVGVIGLSLRPDNTAMEDDLCTHLSDRQRHAYRLRLAMAALLFAGWWTTIQTATEITVTDMAMVRTFAEEVYTQQVAGSEQAELQAVLLSLPLILLLGGLMTWSLVRIGHPLRYQIPTHSGQPLPRAQGLTNFLVWLIILIWAGVPLVGLLLQAAGSDSPMGAQWQRFVIEMQRSFRLNRGLIADSLFWSFLTALIAILLAILMHRWAEHRAVRQIMLLAVAVTLWIVPGPILAFALKRMIAIILDAEESLGDLGFFRYWLYDGPTPVPVMLASGLRFLPFALAWLWPAFTSVSRELCDSASTDGANGWRQFRLCHWPVIRGYAVLGTLMGTAYCLGELSASKPLQVPGRFTYMQELFNLLHYGATTTTAALALLLLVPLAVLMGVVHCLGRQANRR